MTSVFPLADPGRPSRGGAAGHSAAAVIWWLLCAQWRRLALCALVTSVFLGSQQFIPYVVGRGLEEGVLRRDSGRLWLWAGVLAIVIAVPAVAGITSHRYVVRCRLDAIFRAQQALVRHIVWLGAAFRRRVATGEAISVSSVDAGAFGTFAETIGLMCGGMVSFAVVIVLLIAQAPPLALLVGIGMPLMMLALRPSFRQLERRQTAQRAHIGALSAVATDTVMGLRVLRGIGGERYFLNRYRVASRDVRESGMAVSRARATIEAARVFLPGVLLVVLVWTGARMAVSGSLSPGQFVALFGYLIFLTRPLQFAIMGIDALSRAVVAARQLHAVFQLAPPTGRQDDVAGLPWPTGPAEAGADELVDTVTGVTIRPGRLTGLVTDQSARISGLLDRLGCYAHDAPPATYAGIPLSAFAQSDVRRHVHVLYHDAQLFSGTLRDQLDVDGRRTDDEIIRALHAAAALDIVGLDPALAERGAPPPATSLDLHRHVTERGRGFSGGERQRLTLARALLADAAVLLLDDPTAACDAHTEALIAGRLADYRAGRTTAVVTTSPQVLAVCDVVVFVGDELLTGGHADLQDHSAYRRAVTRASGDI